VRSTGSPCGYFDHSTHHGAGCEPNCSGQTQQGVAGTYADRTHADAGDACAYTYETCAYTYAVALGNARGAAAHSDSHKYSGDPYAG